MMLKRYKIIGGERERKEARVELMSYHQHSSPSKVNTIIQILKTRAHIVSLVSDAGTPSISDPGVPLITEAHRQNVPVIPIPGACAVVAALSASGFPAERFIFEGFLPHERAKRKRLLAHLATQERTVAFYESPHRIVHTLTDCVEVWGSDQEAYLARELTKMHEQAVRGPLSSLLATVTVEELEFSPHEEALACH
jgi:16S rRNA (cytidine1402-2'-O)-methyltransferase